MSGKEKEQIKKADPRFESAVFFVKDVEKSKNFYANILGQKITMDFGRNVGFEGGFAIWDVEYALNTIFSEKARSKKIGSNNSEIYFESTDLENLYEKLKEKGVKIIHATRTHPWGQKAFRVFDPDKHIIEFGEPMFIVVNRYHEQGMTIEEISKKTLMPIENINSILKNLKK